MPTLERKIASPPNVPEGFQLEEIDSLDLKNTNVASTAFVCVTTNGTLWFEPELSTMGKIQDGCLYSQRRVHVRSGGVGEFRASREEVLFVCRLTGYIPLEVSSMPALDRIRWEVLSRIGDLCSSSLPLDWPLRRAREKANQIACKHSKTPQGDEAMILKPGLRLFMETGLNGEPWVITRAATARTEKILALYKITNFDPTDMHVPSHVPRSNLALLTEVLADIRKH